MFSKNPFRNTIKESNGLDPDQDWHFVGPDLGLNCLQRLSADNKISVYKERVILEEYFTPQIEIGVSFAKSYTWYLDICIL